MPAKFMIHTNATPHRFEPVTPSGIIAWEEGCLKCAVCVKKKCVYSVYDHRGLNARQMIDSIDNECMNCLRCVQGCPKELIHKSLNPEFSALGDAHYQPNIIERLWYQAETGKIPVSGAGYPGPFSGPGFDAMWTDMSEIVRPTRDGIHGREYISTAVDIGKTPKNLSFDQGGELTGDVPAVLDIPLPIMLRMPAFGSVSENTIKGWAVAARRLGTLFALPLGLIPAGSGPFNPWLMAMIPNSETSWGVPKGGRIVEIAWGDGWKEAFAQVKAFDPGVLVAVRIPLSEDAPETAMALVQGGVSIIHLEATMDSRYHGNPNLQLRDGIRSVHLKLVESQVRDEVTLLASGGLIMAEHVAKAIITGADAVFVDFPMLIALECRMCRRCRDGLSCPVEIETAASGWVAARVMNLIGAWHNQLLEVMGAMGMRDARRLRGEMGRAMVFEELDKATFGSLGKVEEGCDLE
jgi:ferredoxin